MNTNAATKEREPKVKSTEIVQFEEPRLPYHEDVTARFGVDRGQWRVLVETIFPAARSFDSVVMALSYCRARNLDIFKRPVHIVPMWDSKKRGYVETIWPGIAELRTTAFRTGNYAGCDPAEFGPMVEKTFKDKQRRKDAPAEDIEATVKYPEWCRITVYRLLGGQVCKFVGPKVVWTEAYACIGNTTVPNSMWQERAEGQLEKCAEAAALRRAFPEELGNELTAEEMSGRTMTEVREVAAPPRDDEEPPTPPPPPQLTQQQQETVNAVNTAAVDASYLDLVESGRYDPREDDNPPDPSADTRLGQSRQTIGETGTSPAAAASALPAAGEVLLSKNQLISSIAKLEKFGFCDPWADEHGKDMEALSDIDRREVERVFNSKSAALQAAEKKK